MKTVDAETSPLDFGGGRVDFTVHWEYPHCATSPRPLRLNGFEVTDSPEVRTYQCFNCGKNHKVRFRCARR